MPPKHVIDPIFVAAIAMPSKGMVQGVLECAYLFQEGSPPRVDLRLHRGALCPIRGGGLSHGSLPFLWPRACLEIRSWACS